MIVVGIDPGLSGAIAALDGKGGIDVLDMPLIKGGGKTKDEIDELGIFSWLTVLASFDNQLPRVFIEKVSAMPKQGVVSMFRFGVAYGTVRAIVACLDWPVTFLTPQAWRAAAGLSKVVNDTGKALARQRASQLFHAHAHLFARVKDNGRADAALIAWAGARLLAPGQKILS